MIRDTVEAGTLDPHCRDIDQWAQRGLIESIETRRGGMFLFTNDTGALAQSLRHYGEWAENEISLLRSFVTRDSIVLDVGAYIGTHTFAFSSFVGPCGRVYALEAQPASCCVLRHNIQINGLHNAVALNKVVTSGEAPPSIRLATVDLGSMSSYGSTRVNGESDGCPVSQASVVATTTLDDLGLDSCSVIKIDVEGMEEAVISGARTVISLFEPMVYAECNSVEAGVRVLERLRGFGYSVWMHVANPFNPQNWRARSANIFGVNKETALVGVPQDRRSVCGSLQSDPDNILFEIATIDDLVAGMLLKPQYPRDVLMHTRAVRRPT